MNINKKLVDDFFHQCYNMKNYGFIQENFAVEYLDHSPAGARSAADAGGIVRLVHSIFPDIRCETLHLVCEEDIVMHHGRFRATHAGEYCGVPASGRIIEWEAMEIFRIVEGKVVESWGFWPDRQMMEQMK